MKNIRGVSHAEHILREIEEARNGGFPSGHPAVYFARKGDESQKIGEANTKLIAKFKEAQRVIEELERECIEAQRGVVGARFSSVDEERRGFLVVSRAARFVGSVKSGIAQQLKLLEK